MSSLANLPHEMLLQVIESISLHDVESFTLTCRNFYHLGRRKLELHRSRKKNNCISVGRTGYSWFYNDARLETVNPILILRDIIEDDDFARYCTKFCISGCDDPIESELLQSEDQTSKNQDVLDQYKGEIFTQLSQCPYLEGHNEIQEWHEAVKDVRKQSHVAALLLTLLPNIQSLSLVRSKFSTTALKFMSHRIAEASTNASQHRPHALSKLFSLWFDGSGRDDGGDLEIYRPLLELPSIRSITGCDIYAKDFHWSLSPKSSNISSVRMIDSAIDAPSFLSLFSVIKAVRHFSYGLRCLPIRNVERGHLRGVVAALLSNAKGSLEELELNDDDRSGIWAHFCQTEFIGSLQGFEILKKVKLSGNMLVKWDRLGRHKASIEGHCFNCSVQPLMEILPTSVRRVELTELAHHITMDKPEQVAANLFKDLPEVKKERLPILKKIILPDPEVIDTELKARYEHVGIELLKPKGPQIFRPEWLAGGDVTAWT